MCKTKGKEINCTICFLNPSSSFWNKVCSEISIKGYEKVYSDEINNVLYYQKEDTCIKVALCQDYVGTYIFMECECISETLLNSGLAMCPECGSNNFRVTILFSWRNHITEELYEKDKLDYGPGAYDRHGTLPPTHKCKNCGCKWHNGAKIYRWNEMIRNGGSLTEEVLGVIRDNSY